MVKTNPDYFSNYENKTSKQIQVWEINCTILFGHDSLGENLIWSNKIKCVTDSKHDIIHWIFSTEFNVHLTMRKTAEKNNIIAKIPY